jgi:hypothetical protein
MLAGWKLRVYQLRASRIIGSRRNSYNLMRSVALSYGVLLKGFPPG